MLARLRKRTLLEPLAKGLLGRAQAPLPESLDGLLHRGQLLVYVDSDTFDFFLLLRSRLLCDLQNFRDVDRLLLKLLLRIQRLPPELLSDLLEGVLLVPVLLSQVHVVPLQLLKKLFVRVELLPESHDLLLLFPVPLFQHLIQLCQLATLVLVEIQLALELLHVRVYG